MLGGIVSFLVGALADFFSFLLLARFIMQWSRVSFAGPLGEFVLILTNGMVKPLRRIIPGVFGLDWASVVAAWLIQSATVLLGFVLSPLPVDNPLVLAFGLGAVDVLVLAVWVLIIALIAQALLSWINPHSPFAPAVGQMTRPVLRPIQRILPPIGGRIDLSPLLVILLLQVVLRLIDEAKVEVFLK
jgi:YggT family protein